MIEQFTLECIKGRIKGKVFTFPGCGYFTLGRKRTHDVPIPDGTVSVNHCTIIADGRDIWLRDSGSTNGTFIGSEKIDEYMLHDGDVITLGGSCELRLTLKYGISPQDELIMDDIVKTMVSGMNGDVPAEEDKPDCICEMCGKSFPREKCVEGVKLCPECMERDPEVLLRFLLAGEASAKDEDAGVLAAPGYREIRKLGEGAFGSVSLVQELSSGKYMAMKTLRDVTLGQELEQKKFAREMDIVSQLSHEKIVETFGTGQDDEKKYILQEYCPGGNLAQYIGRTFFLYGGKLPVDAAVDITLQILSALEYAHTVRIQAKNRNGETENVCGVVHRDIHPGNIFVIDASDGVKVKVGDWGLSKAFELSGRSGISLGPVPRGTYSFAPRQQWINFRYSGPDVDVWSAAAVLYYMLTGRPPRESGIPGTDFSTEAEVPPVQLYRSDLPSALAEALNYTLDETFGLRVRTAAELSEMISGALK